MDDAKPQSGGEKPRMDQVLEQEFDIIKYKQGKYITIRLLDTPAIAFKQHWINILSPKQKREISIPKCCINFDPVNAEAYPDGDECPYCEASDGSEGIRDNVYYYVNAIVREIQEDGPNRPNPPTKKEAKTGFKDVNSDSWTPVRVLRLTPGVFAKIIGFKKINKVKGQEVNVFDPDNGCDVMIQYTGKKGADAYDIQKGERSPLTDEELEYLTFDLEGKAEEIYDKAGRETLKEAKRELDRMEIVDGKEFDDDDEEDLGKRGKSSSSGKRSRSSDDEDDDRPARNRRGRDSEDEEDDERPARGRNRSRNSEDEDEEDEKPARGRSSRNRDDDDDDEEENPRNSRNKRQRHNEDEEEEEDDQPRRSRNSRNRDDDDDDDDEDDQPRRSRSKRNHDDDDEDDDQPRRSRNSRNRDDDDDEDDERPARGRRHF